MTDIGPTDEYLKTEMARIRAEVPTSTGSFIPMPTVEAARAMIRHGYDWRALASGVSCPPRTWEGSGGVLLRSRVCSLDGIEVDGHQGSDLDPGGICIHCDELEGEDD